VLGAACLPAPLSERPRQISARGKFSDVPVSGEEVWLVRFKDGKCVEYRECGTLERALELADPRPEE